MFSHNNDNIKRATKVNDNTASRILSHTGSEKWKGVKEKERPKANPSPVIIIPRPELLITLWGQGYPCNIYVWPATDRTVSIRHCLILGELSPSTGPRFTSHRRVFAEGADGGGVPWKRSQRRPYGGVPGTGT